MCGTVARPPQGGASPARHARRPASRSPSRMPTGREDMITIKRKSKQKNSGPKFRHFTHRQSLGAIPIVVALVCWRRARRRVRLALRTARTCPAVAQRTGPAFASVLFVAHPPVLAPSRARALLCSHPPACTCRPRQQSRARPTRSSRTTSCARPTRARTTTRRALQSTPPTHTHTPTPDHHSTHPPPYHTTHTHVAHAST